MRSRMWIGAMNSIRSMATVATGPMARCEATIPPAMSIWLSTQPPKMWPLALMSPGPGTTRRIGSALGASVSLFVIHPSAIGFLVMARAAADEQEPHQPGSDQHGEADPRDRRDRHRERHRLAR